MKKLPALLDLWNTPDFEKELQRALQQLGPDHLPLKKVANFSGLFVQDTLQFSLLKKQESDQSLILKLSIFYQEISNLCPCSGEEAETAEGHCEMQETIAKSDGLIDFNML